MRARFAQKEAHEGVWARRLAVFFIQLLVLTVLLHRFGLLSTPPAINLLGICFLGLFCALCLALFALARIWFADYRGAPQPVLAILIAVIGLAPFAWFGAEAAQLPALTDVATTPLPALPFKNAAIRPTSANPIVPPNPAQIAKQEAAYPDIKPMPLERSAPEAFALVRDAMKRLDWTIVTLEASGQAGNPPGTGYIEATARTEIMGYTDDVAVSVTGAPAAASSTVDVRSVSRYGRSDLGANAERIRALFAEVKSGIEKGEKPVLEQVPPENPPVPVKKKKRRKHRNRG